MADYFTIGGGYKGAVLRVGAVIQNPEGREVYFQPGDDAALIGETIAAFDEISEDVNDAKRGMIVDMTLGEYFA